MKIGKIKLRSAVELSDSEMKAVWGSYYGYDDYFGGCYRATCTCARWNLPSMPHLPATKVHSFTGTCQSQMNLDSARTCQQWGFTSSNCLFEPAGALHCL